MWQTEKFKFITNPFWLSALLDFVKNYFVLMKLFLCFLSKYTSNCVFVWQKVSPDGEPTSSAHPARFSPDDKFSRHRVLVKKRFGILLTQQPKPLLWERRRERRNLSGASWRTLWITCIFYDISLSLESFVRKCWHVMTRNVFLMEFYFISKIKWLNIHFSLSSQWYDSVICSLIKLKNAKIISFLLLYIN